MNVSLLTETTTWGGAEVFTAAVAERLVQRGHEATIVTFGEPVYESGRLPAGVKTIHRASGRKVGLLSAKEQARLLRDCGGDVAIFVKGSFSTGNWTFDLQARRIWRRYYAVEQLTCDPMPPLTSGRHAFGLVPGVGAWWWRIWLSRAVRAYLTTGSICVSEAGAARLSQEYSYPRGRMIVLRNGADTSRFVFDPSLRARVRQEWGIDQESHFVFGVIGRLAQVKRVDRALRAFAAVSREFGDRQISLMIVGEGPLEAGLRELTSRLALSASVRFLPFCPRPESVYCAVDAFVLASENEGLPLALCEAMACGRVAIATDVGGTSEVLNSREVGRLVPNGDEDALRDAMIWAAFLSEAERARIGDDARRRIVKEFSLSAQVAAILALVETGKRGRRFGSLPFHDDIWDRPGPMLSGE